MTLISIEGDLVSRKPHDMRARHEPLGECKRYREREIRRLRNRAAEVKISIEAQRMEQHRIMARWSVVFREVTAVNARPLKPLGLTVLVQTRYSKSRENVSNQLFNMCRNTILSDRRGVWTPTSVSEH